MPLADRLPRIPFPADVKTAPLRVVDYPSLVADDAAACAALLASATELGFFYLRDTGLDYEPLKDACAAVFDLDEADKRAFDVGKLGSSFGFKAVGTDNVDEAGSVDTNEQFNIGADDILAGLSENGGLHGHGYPRPIVDAADALSRFTREATAVCYTLLARFERALGLPDGALKRLHEQGADNRSPTKARVIRNPPQDDGSRLALGSHTDFGSITLLDNTLTGGLQVLPPGSDEWLFVKPLEGCIVVNLADLLSIFSGGILRSNLHRVLPPPGAQRACARWSGIFFLVPEYGTPVRPLEDASEAIRQAAKGMKNRPAEGTTCKMWFDRRLFGVRAVNRTGPESWINSRGTEHIIVEGHSARARAEEQRAAAVEAQ